MLIHKIESSMCDELVQVTMIILPHLKKSLCEISLHDYIWIIDWENLSGRTRTELELKKWVVAVSNDHKIISARHSRPEI